MRPFCLWCCCSSKTETFIVGLVEVGASISVSVFYSYLLFLFLVNLFVHGGADTEYFVSMLLLFCGHILGMTRLVFGFFLLFAITQGSVSLLVRWIKAKVYLLFFSVSVQVILFGCFGKFSSSYWYGVVGSFVLGCWTLLVVYNYFVELAGTEWLPPPSPNSPTSESSPCLTPTTTPISNV